MADVSVSDVKVEFAGVKFTLRATVESLVSLEKTTGEAYPLVVGRALNGTPPRLTDLTEVFAAIALPHGKHNAAGLRALIAFADQGERFKELHAAIGKAVTAAMPQNTTTEAGNGAKADPQ